MTIASCPKCDDKVSLPADASSKATVSCPLCQAEFELSEILDTLPPLLIVVDDPEPPTSTATATSLGTVVGPLEDDELKLADPEPVSLSPDFGIQSSVAPASTTTAAPRNRKSRPRSKRKKSPAMEMVKVVLGGVTGLTIAYLLLWWIPFDYKLGPLHIRPTDFAGIGPSVSKVVPWIVPKKFHAKETSSDNADGLDLPESVSLEPAAPGKTTELSESGLPIVSLGDIDNTGQTGQPKKNRKQRRPPKPASADDTQSEDASANREPAAGIPKLDPLVEVEDPLAVTEPEPKTPDIASNALEDLTVDLDPLTMLEQPITATEPKVEEPESTSPPEIAQSITSRLPNAQKVTAEDLDRALLETEPAVQAWNDAPNAASYLAFAKLGEAVALAEQISPEAKDAVHGLLELLGSDSGKTGILAKAGARLLDPGAREGSGVLLVGVVKEIKREGDLYETQLELASGDAPVLLYQDTDPAKVYQAGSDVLVLGAVVEDPANNLIGYDGNAKSVVWSGAARAVTEE